MCTVGKTGSNLGRRNREALQPSPLPYIRFLTFVPLPPTYLLQDLKALLQDIPTSSLMLPSLCHDWDLGTKQT